MLFKFLFCGACWAGRSSRWANCATARVPAISRWLRPAYSRANLTFLATVKRMSVSSLLLRVILLQPFAQVSGHVSVGSFVRGGFDLQRGLVTWQKGAEPPQAFDFARVAELPTNETDKLVERPEYPVRSVLNRREDESLGPSRCGCRRQSPPGAHLSGQR